MKIILICLFLVVLGCNNGSDSSVHYSLKTIGGKERRIEIDKSSNGAVFIFLIPDCPFSQFYSMAVNQIYSIYSTKGYKFYGIVPGKLYSAAEIDSFKNDFSFFPEILVDEDYKLSRTFKIKVVPQVVLTDWSGALLYSGKIDDQAIRPGEKKYRATKFYLLNAMKEHLSGATINIKKTEAVGCFIE